MAVLVHTLIRIFNHLFHFTLNCLLFISYLKCRVCTVAKFPISLQSLLWNCLENLPGEQMALAGRRIKLKPGLYTLHTHFPISRASFCKREQQRSSGNLTMGLFWKTRLFIGAFLHAAATVNTLDTGECLCRLEKSIEPPLAGMISITLIIMVSIMNVMCSLFDPFVKGTKKQRSI